MPDNRLLILGASARAACFSAQRSAYSPYWIDQYGDHDLTENFPGECVSPDKYPAEILDHISNSPDVPFLYTGAMENHVQVLEQLEGLRTLMGNTADVCRSVRDPWLTRQCFLRADIAHPLISKAGSEIPSTGKVWLLKPIHSAGGLGITYYPETTGIGKETHYLQEYIQGESRAGVFLGDGKTCCLLGVTHQLTGEAFLNAAEFAYCGSVGPLQLDTNEKEQWENIGQALVVDFGLKGLFGVDAISRKREIYPLEVNPRYTASVEVLDLALDIPVLAMHCNACNGILPSSISTDRYTMIGKGYLFAHQDLKSPENVKELYHQGDELRLTADIPQANTLISRGHPIMTILAQGKNHEDVIQLLKSRSELLYSKFELV
jgi:uncharacterized protein